jgi:hypothetical protein
MKTNREAFLERFGLPETTSLSLKEIASLSGMPQKALEEVRDRGVGAWKTSVPSIRVKGSFEKNLDTKAFPRKTRLGKEQWSFARVYAFVQKTDKVYYGADDDIRERYGLR